MVFRLHPVLLSPQGRLPAANVLKTRAIFLDCAGHSLAEGDRVINMA
jgi:hypothetical protein